MRLRQGIIRALFSRLRSKAGRRLLLSFVAAIATRLALLVLAVVLARQFGPADYGIFTFSTGVAVLAAQAAVLGWPMLMNRLIPGLLKDGDWPRLKGLRDTADAVVATASLTAVALLFGLGLLFPRLGLGFALGAALVVPFAFAILRRQQLAAMRRPALGLLMDQGFGAALAIVVLLAVGLGSVTGATLLFAGSILLGVGGATIVFRRLLPAEVASASRRVELRLWMSLALPMLVGMSSKLLMNKTDVLMLAPLSDMHQTGLYGAAFRITYLLTFPQLVMMGVVAPMLSEAFTDGRMDQTGRLIRMALLFALVTAIPLALPLIIFPETILSMLFGREFSDAAPVLIILSIGQLATSFSIPFQSALTMGGREKVYGALHFGALAVHACINLVVIPRYGALGAAMSTLCIALFLLVAQIWLNRAVVRGRATEK